MHLSNENIKALCDHNAIEQDKIKYLEHISSCDMCLNKYIEYMENQEMYSPPKGFIYDIKIRIKEKYCPQISKVAYTLVGIAAAISLWVSGAFNMILQIQNQVPSQITPIMSSIESKIANSEKDRIYKQHEIYKQKFLKEQEEFYNEFTKK